MRIACFNTESNNKECETIFSMLHYKLCFKLTVLLYEDVERASGFVFLV